MVAPNGRSICILFIGLTSVFVPSANADSFAGGNVTGNGGDAVVCRDSSGNVTSTELFDYVEARIQYKIAIDLGDTTQDPATIASYAVSRLKTLDPRRAASYQQQISTFFDNANLIPGVVLTPIPDIRNVIIPNGCTIEQLAIQKEPELPQDRLFTISKDLWDRLSNGDRAGLMLHEIIYHEAIRLGQTDSVRTRYFNSVISSPGITQMSQMSYADLLSRIGFPTGSAGVNVIPLKYDGVFPVTDDPHVEEQLCDSRQPGDALFADNGRRVHFDFCVGTFGTPGQAYFADEDDGLEAAYRSNKIQAIYAGLFTDTVNGVTDISTVALVETDVAIFPYCGCTDYSLETETSGFGLSPANKNNPGQMQALQTHDGFCTQAHLVDYHDLTRVILDKQLGRQEFLTLNKVYP